MVESFKEHYKDEAQFDITIDVQADAKVRDVMLTDVHNGADVFSFPDDQLSAMVAIKLSISVFFLDYSLSFFISSAGFSTNFCSAWLAVGAMRLLPP